MVNMSERIRFLRDAAARAEREGSRRVADLLRSMAKDARPLAVQDGGWVVSEAP
jgi:hypothetical protein